MLLFCVYKVGMYLPILFYQINPIDVNIFLDWSNLRLNTEIGIIHYNEAFSNICRTFGYRV